MALLAAMQSAALVLVGRKPANFYGSVDTFENEIADLANEVAEDVARYQDWQALQKIGQIDGDGATIAYNLPLDYSRMLKNADIQASAYGFWNYARYDDLNSFIRDQETGFRAVPGGWILMGGKIHFSPAPNGSARFPYISTLWARGTDGALKSSFTADDDTFLLPERLIKLGLIWRWRENKKLDASGDQEAFIKALDEYAFSDAGSRVYRYGGRRSFPGTHLAWPGVLGGGNDQWDATEW